MAGLGMNDRNVYRRIDIVNALAACIYAAKANGGTVDKGIVGSLCLAFGIDAAEVGQRVLEMERTL